VGTPTARVPIPTDPTPKDARAALAAERATTLNRIGAMTAEFDEIVSGSADSNADDEHDPEGSTIAFERAQTAALLGDARGYLEELDGAAGRLDAGSYWTCARCGGPIGAARLRARPATQTCILCATAPQPAG
jgi:RNA polymerase-binding transcription factor DksA